jgi:hypothetical protein
MESRTKRLLENCEYIICEIKKLKDEPSEEFKDKTLKLIEIALEDNSKEPQTDS